MKLGSTFNFCKLHTFYIPLSIPETFHFSSTFLLMWNHFALIDRSFPHKFSLLVVLPVCVCRFALSAMKIITLRFSRKKNKNQSKQQNFDFDHLLNSQLYSNLSIRTSRLDYLDQEPVLEMLVIIILLFRFSIIYGGIGLLIKT